MSRRAEVLKYDGDQDPKQVVFDAVRDALANIELFGNRVLVATAPHLERTAGGIIMTDKTISEERFQGKTGLVLKLGETAFKYDGSFEWVGDAPVAGEWVFYRTPDSWECGVNGVSCRVIRDENIIGRVAAPGTIW